MALTAFSEYSQGKDRSTITVALATKGGKEALFEFGRIERREMLKEQKIKIQQLAHA